MTSTRQGGTHTIYRTPKNFFGSTATKKEEWHIKSKPRPYPAPCNSLYHWTLTPQPRRKNIQPEQSSAKEPAPEDLALGPLNQHHAAEMLLLEMAPLEVVSCPDEVGGLGLENEAAAEGWGLCPSERGQPRSSSGRRCTCRGSRWWRIRAPTGPRWTASRHW